jgi:hypothetical protein
LQRVRPPGYEPYTLFPWVVSDFGLIEAIESGLVKIPFLPSSDDAQALDLPVLRNLYEHVKEKLPRAGQKRQRKIAKEKGEAVPEGPPHLPDIVKAALAQMREADYSRCKNRSTFFESARHNLRQHRSSTAIKHFSEPFLQSFAALQRLVKVFFGKREDLHRLTGNDGRIARRSG